MIPNEITKPVLLFDGVCNLCSGLVAFAIRRDPKRKFLFASLQSEAGQELLRQFQLPASNFDTFVLVNRNQHYIKSTAALQVVKRLGGLWSIFYVLIVVPKPIRDAVYEWVARHRYRWFGKKEQCMLPTSDIKSRFLEFSINTPNPKSSSGPKERL